MRGHQNLIQLRMQGKSPAFVFVNDYPCQTDWLETGAHATVCTAGDPISSLDMRFLTGLQVSISATTEARAKALFDLAKRAGAKAVAACHVLSTANPWGQDGWAEVWRKQTDENRMETAA